MSGWVSLFALLAMSLGASLLLGLRGAMLRLVAAATLLGAAGYVLQGRPSLAGTTARAGTSSQVVPLTGARHAFFGEFTGAESWMRISEGYARRGNTEDATGILINAANRYPHDPQLWVGLGNALVDQAGMMTPAADLAFARAEAVAPGHPAAPFFRGLALARSGDRSGALALWRKVLADAPADASWRPMVEDAVAALSSPRIRGEEN